MVNTNHWYRRICRLDRAKRQATTPARHRALYLARQRLGGML